MKLQHRPYFVAREQGSALIVVVLSVTLLAGLSAALMAVNGAASRAQVAETERVSARYVCQAGLTEAMFRLTKGENPVIATSEQPAAFGAATYWVTSEEPTPGITRLRATGFEDGSGASMELVVREVPNTIWRYGAFGREFLHMDSNARVDSYDSSLGTYASQATNGSGSSTHAHTNGHVGSNGDVSLDQNAHVWGDAVAGPDHATTVLGNATVTGSTTPASAEVEMPGITVPTYPSFGNVNVNANTTIPASDRAYGNMVIGNNRTLTITGPANLVVTNLTLNSGSRIVANAAAGPVTILVLDDFLMNSNAWMYASDQRPENLSLMLLSDNVINPEVLVELDTVDFNSNSGIHGTIYAPDAAITFDSNFELFGAIIARSLDIDSNSRFHFDEALIDATASGDPIFETICWRDVPLEE